MRGIYYRIRDTYRRIMAPVWVRKVYLVVGTTICLGIFYRPFIKSAMFPRSQMTEEQLRYYDLENIYAVKKRKETLAALQRPKSSSVNSNPDNVQSEKSPTTQH